MTELKTVRACVGCGQDFIPGPFATLARRCVVCWRQDRTTFDRVGIPRTGAGAYLYEQLRNAQLLPEDIAQMPYRTRFDIPHLGEASLQRLRTLVPYAGPPAEPEQSAADNGGASPALDEPSARLSRACRHLDGFSHDEIKRVCIRSMNRGSLASERRQRLPTYAERRKMERWVGRTLSAFEVISAVVAGDLDLTGYWYGDGSPSVTRFDWEHASPDWMNPTPPAADADQEPEDGQEPA